MAGFNKFIFSLLLLPAPADPKACCLVPPSGSRSPMPMREKGDVPMEPKLSVCPMAFVIDSRRRVRPTMAKIAIDFNSSFSKSG
jgi:hypothetical protein